MAKALPARAIPTVELSVAATSEELQMLAADAQRRHMSLKDYLRLQLMAVAKLAAKAEQDAVLTATLPTAAPAPVNLSTGRQNARRAPAFLP